MVAIPWASPVTGVRGEDTGAKDSRWTVLADAAISKIASFCYPHQKKEFLEPEDA